VSTPPSSPSSTGVGTPAASETVSPVPAQNRPPGTGPGAPNGSRARYWDARALQALLDAHRASPDTEQAIEQVEHTHGVGTVQESNGQARALSTAQRPSRPKATQSYVRPGPARSHWHDHANCGPAHRGSFGLATIQHVDAVFEVGPHTRTVPDLVRVICGLCPVRSDCLREAVLEQQASNSTHVLVRGGLTPSQITRLIRTRKQAVG
jgi:hypothetical protein